MNPCLEEVVIIICKTHSTRVLFTRISRKFVSYKFIVISDFNNFKNQNYKNLIPKTIFLEITKYHKINELLKLIDDIKRSSSFLVNVPIILISEQNFLKNDSLFKNLFKNGVDFILQKPIDIFILESLLYKNLLRIRDCENVYRYHEIELYRNLNLVYFRNCRIYLVCIETTLLSLLISENREFTKEEIKESILIENQIKVTDTYLQVIICRLRKKFKNVSNINIIKNRKGRGYYITI